LFTDELLYGLVLLRLRRDNSALSFCSFDV